MVLTQMFPGKVNSPATSLVTGITSVVTSITLVDASVLPAGPNICTIGVGDAVETILYTSKTGNTLNNVTRGFQGTAKDWTVGTTVARNFTAYDYDTIIQNILAINGKMENIDNKGVVNGYPSLDTNGKMPISQNYNNIVSYNLGVLPVSSNTVDAVYFNANVANLKLPIGYSILSVTFTPSIVVPTKAVYLSNFPTTGKNTRLYKNSAGTNLGLSSQYICSFLYSAGSAKGQLMTDAEVIPYTAGNNIIINDSNVISAEVPIPDIPTVSLNGKILYGTTFVDIVDDEIFIRDDGSGTYLLTMLPNGEVYAKDLINIGGI